MVGGAVSILAVLLYGILRGGWLDAVLAGIALGMSMLPEEFPSCSRFHGDGCLRICGRGCADPARCGDRRLLGSASSIRVPDKTGTLTENQMSIAELRAKECRDFFRPCVRQPQRKNAREIP